MTKNKSTIFGASQLRLQPGLETILKDNKVLKVSPIIFRICRRAIYLRHLFMDLSVAEEDDAIIKNGDVHLFLLHAKYRGGCRIPSYYSPGYIAVMGNEDNDLEASLVDSEAERFPFQDLYRSKMDVLLMETAQEFSMLMNIVAVRATLSKEAADVEEENAEISMGTLQLVEDADNENVFILNFLALEEKTFSIHSMVDIGLKFESLISCWRQETVDNASIENYLLPFFDASSLICTTLMVALNVMENTRKYESAVDLLMKMLWTQCQSRGARYHRKRAYWWTRLVIDLGHCGRKKEALEVCAKALKDPSLDTMCDPDLFGLRVKLLNHCEDVEDDVQQILLNAPVAHIIAKPFGPSGKGSGFQRKLRYLEPGDSSNVTCSVETFALHHYAEDVNGGWRGIHTENYSLREIFNLLMKDIMLGGQDQIEFIKRLVVYGDRPLDIAAPFGKFYDNRKEMIDSRLAEMKTWTTEVIITKLSEAFYAQSTRIQARKSQRSTLAVLQLISACLGPTGLATICEMFCKEFRIFGRGGAPDLLLVRIDNRGLLDSVFDDPTIQELDPQTNIVWTKEGSSIRFVEVKSENDRLADRQVAWMNGLHSRGFDCQVLKVGTTTSKKVGRSIKPKSKPKSKNKCEYSTQTQMTLEENDDEEEED